MIDNEKIAARVRALRAERKWTQAELGEKASMTRQQVGAVEGGTFPTIAQVNALAAAFGVAVTELLGVAP